MRVSVVDVPSRLLLSAPFGPRALPLRLGSAGDDSHGEECEDVAIGTAKERHAFERGALRRGAQTAQHTWTISILSLMLRPLLSVSRLRF